jgi:hypothetical protein
MFRRARMLLLAVLVVPATGSYADVWELASGFSLHRNPDGPWSLGAKSSFGGDLRTFTNNASVSSQYNTNQLVGWSPAGRVVPYVAQNVSESIWAFDGGDSIVGPGEVLVHPDSQMSVVRWTAPESGLFEINASFRRFENRSGFQSGFHVLHNEHELPGSFGVLSGFGGPAALASYTDQLILNGGDSIEFVVDMGPDGTSAADGTIVGASIARIPRIVVPGDFNGNGSLDIGDLDQLLAGIRQGSNLIYDLHMNNNLDHEDRRVWVEDLKRTYFGDSNLDGEFNSTDLIAVLGVGKYENGVPHDTTWAEGDWNGDADFDSSDLVLAISSGGYERGPRAAAAAIVPEPSAGIVLGVGIVLAVDRMRRRRKGNE